MSPPAGKLKHAPPTRKSACLVGHALACPSAWWPNSWGNRLFDFDDAVALYVVDRLRPAARPADLNSFHAGIRPQPEADQRLAGGSVTDAGGGVPKEHAPVWQRDADHGPESLPVAPPAMQLHRQPVPAAGRDVVEQLRRTVQGGDHDIDEAIVVEIGKRRPVVHGGLLEVRSGAGGNILEAPSFEVAKDPVRQRGVAPDVTVQVGEVRQGKEQVLPAVVVEVVHAEAPAGQLARAHQQPGTLAKILEERPFAEISKQEKPVDRK